MLIIWNLDFTGSPSSGHAIIRPDGTCLACDALQALYQELGGP
jgi:hypothetical protein